MIKILSLLVGFSLFLIGVFTLGTLAYDLYKSSTSANWRSVEGVITSIGVNASSVKNSATGGSHAAYTSDIKYSYLVGGKEYIGSKIHFSTLVHASDYEKVKDALRNYDVGKPVKVFYNPDDVSESVLIRNVSDIYFNFIFGLTFFLFGFFVLKKLIYS